MSNLEWDEEWDETGNGGFWRLRDESDTVAPNKVIVTQDILSGTYMAQFWHRLSWHTVGQYPTLEEAKAVGALMYRIEGEMT